MAAAVTGRLLGPPTLCRWRSHDVVCYAVRDHVQQFHRKAGTREKLLIEVWVAARKLDSKLLTTYLTKIDVLHDACTNAKEN